MPRGSAPTRRRRAACTSVLAVPLAGLLVLSACDTGDGRELRPPTAPPPSITVAPTDEPVDLPGGDVTPDELTPDVGDVDDDSALLPEFAFEVFAAWRDGAPIDPRHTCDGADVSPALTWTGVPDGTADLAITVVDEHAEGSVHWVVTGIDPSAVSALEGSVPAGATELENSFGTAGWTGPCPPADSAHTYRFALHALDQQFEPTSGDSAAATVATIEALAIASTSVTGTYER